jgi:hypothetical protein
MDKRTKLIVGALAAIIVVGIGAGVGIAAGGDDDRPLTGSDYDRATQAALDHVGEGTVTETEAGDDGAAYEVEIRRHDGSQVEILLDDKFEVVGSESDDDGAEDDD